MNDDFTCPFKIDLVYLWVDGSDPKWLAKKNAALSAAGRNTVDFSAITGRFDDNDELRFSLRSVERFMPWINHIFIVTDAQTPEWLNPENKKITVVDQNDLVPKEYLPMYNSGAIEMCLGRIPELSEHFIYANDDMMAGRPLSPGFFFDVAGNPIVILREKRRRHQHSMVGTQVANARELIFNATGKKYFMTLTHAMDACRKSHLLENTRTFYGILTETTFTTFRRPTNIQRVFNRFYDNALGRNTITTAWRVGNKRIEIGPDEPWVKTMWRRMICLFCPLKYDFYDAKNMRKVRVLKPAVFCVNNGGLFALNLVQMRELFPDKSRFER
jgi:hypothetical protein